MSDTPETCESDTPETDKFIVSAGYVRTDHQWRTFARKLERERDDARAELEMWRDGNILHEIHRDELEKVERERDNLADQRDMAISEMDRLERERDEAREALLQ
jgi:hypothetical protein